MTSQWPARHSKLIIFYLAFQRVSQYLRHLVNTDTFLHTSTRYGSRRQNLLQLSQSEGKESHAWQILLGNAPELL